MMIWDVHGHVFPEKIAAKAVESIGAFYGYSMECDGSPETLICRHKKAGIEKGVIHSVAITPRQVSSINHFIAECESAHPEELIGFGAIHADCEQPEETANEVIRLGLHGLKIHPDMQAFALDSPGAMEMFAAIEGKLPIMIHTGDRRFNYSHPAQMEKVAKAFPKLICICAHLGGWSEWDEATARLSRFENVYVDTSSSLYTLSPQEAVRVIRSYSRERVMFGTDYPMWDPAEEINRFMALPLSDDEKEAILGKNAERLLRIPNNTEAESI